MSDAELARLRAVAETMSLRRWGETIEDKLDPTEWKSQGGKLAAKDGLLIMSSGDNPLNDMLNFGRHIPGTEAAASSAVRIDAWVEFEQQPQLIGMYLGPKDQLTNWECMYFFSAGGESGMQTLHLRNGESQRHGESKPIPVNKPVHVWMEVAGCDIRAGRDGFALTGRKHAGFDLENSSIGFTGHSGPFKIHRITYSRLTPAISAQDEAALWRTTRFAEQQALTDYLTKNVVSRLDDRDWQRRQDAHDLLASLMPLSLPALRLAVRQVGAETALRAEHIISQDRPARIEKYTPTPGRRSPAVSQPDKDQPSGRE